MHEKRLTKRLNNYWDLIRKDDIYPDLTKFNASAIADIWDHCIIFSKNPDGKSWRFHQMGEKLKKLYGDDMEGQNYNPTQKFPQSTKIARKIADVNEETLVIYDAGTFISDKNKVIKYRSCVLPFGNEKNGITSVILGVSWREFS